MIHVKGSVNINASPEQVFVLLSDARQCAELNPRIEVIDIATEPAGELRQGSIFHYRIVVEGRMTEYSSRVLSYEPDQSLEVQTDTDPVVNIKYKITPDGEGAILEQVLTSSAAERRSEPVEYPGWFSRLVDRLVKTPQSPEEDAVLRRKDEAIVQEQLQSQLDEWLMIIKKYLEDQRSKFMA